MIKRYSRKEMCEIWTSEQKFQIWLELECHACDAMAKLGVIPKKSAENIWKKAKFDPAKQDNRPVKVVNFPRRCRFTSFN